VLLIIFTQTLDWP